MEENEFVPHTFDGGTSWLQAYVPCARRHVCWDMSAKTTTTRRDDPGQADERASCDNEHRGRHGARSSLRPHEKGAERAW